MFHHINPRTFARRDPYQPEFFLDRKTHEAMSFAIQRREAGFVGNRTQLAVSVVAPRMIGATETHRAGAASFDDARPAMTTDVCECAEPAFIVACHQDRRGSESIGEVIAG